MCFGVDGDEVEDVVPVEAEQLALDDLSDELLQRLLLEAFHLDEEAARALADRLQLREVVHSQLVQHVLLDLQLPLQLLQRNVVHLVLLLLCDFRSLPFKRFPQVFLSEERVEGSGEEGQFGAKVVQQVKKLRLFAIGLKPNPELAVFVFQQFDEFPCLGAAVELVNLPVSEDAGEALADTRPPHLQSHDVAALALERVCKGLQLFHVNRCGDVILT